MPRFFDIGASGADTEKTIVEVRQMKDTSIPPASFKLESAPLTFLDLPTRTTFKFNDGTEETLVDYQMWMSPDDRVMVRMSDGRHFEFEGGKIWAAAQIKEKLARKVEEDLQNTEELKKQAKEAYAGL